MSWPVQAMLRYTGGLQERCKLPGAIVVQELLSRREKIQGIGRAGNVLRQPTRFALDGGK